MSSMTRNDQADDGSEDVSDFLQRIRELGNKRDREDEERTRRLEEEILQGRRERQARRAGTLTNTSLIIVEECVRICTHTLCFNASHGTLEMFLTFSQYRTR